MKTALHDEVASLMSRLASARSSLRVRGDDGQRAQRNGAARDDGLARVVERLRTTVDELERELNA